MYIFFVKQWGGGRVLTCQPGVICLLTLIVSDFHLNIEILTMWHLQEQTVTFQNAKLNDTGQQKART